MTHRHTHTHTGLPCGKPDNACDSFCRPHLRVQIDAAWRQPKANLAPQFSTAGHLVEALQFKQGAGASSATMVVFAARGVIVLCLYKTGCVFCVKCWQTTVWHICVVYPSPRLLAAAQQHAGTARFSVPGTGA